MKNTATEVQAIKIKKSDWRKIPAYHRSMTDGVPKVLTKQGFMPVEIIEA